MGDHVPLSRLKSPRLQVAMQSVLVHSFRLHRYTDTPPPRVLVRVHVSVFV